MGGYFGKSRDYIGRRKLEIKKNLSIASERSKKKDTVKYLKHCMLTEGCNRREARHFY